MCKTLPGKKHFTVCTSGNVTHPLSPDVNIYAIEQLVRSNATANYQRPVIFLEGDYWLGSPSGCLKWGTEGARGNKPLIRCLPTETPVQGILYAPGIVGFGSACDIQPREELLSNCVLPSGCPQPPVIFCFDDGNSSILCSGGSACILLGICCVHRFSIELVWSYQLRCQTHLLLQFEFSFAN